SVVRVHVTVEKFTRSPVHVFRDRENHFGAPVYIGELERICWTPCMKCVGGKYGISLWESLERAPKFRGLEEKRDAVE
ncbi:unnamed protein product, partial [Allacma fusca]